MKLKFLFGMAWMLSVIGVAAQNIQGEVTKLVVADGKLIVGGQFEKADRRIVNNITSWDGAKYAGLAKGIDGKCHAIAVNGKNIYAAGDFSVVNKATDGSCEIQSNRIAHWDGTKWNSLGAQTVDRDVYATAIKDGKLYIGGNFTKLGGEIETRGVGMWDGKKWNAVGNAQFDRAILAMVFVGNDLYVGGIFTINGDDPAEGIAKWDGKNWTEPIRGGLRGIKSLATDGKKLYIGGEFGVKVFDGTTLNDIKGAPQGEIRGLHVEGDKLYIAGDFEKVNGKASCGVAMFDGGKWTGFPEIPYSMMNAVTIYNGILYAGGQFNVDKFGGYAKFENGAWTPVLQ
jgi:trimeric autotransporter adhesin